MGAVMVVVALAMLKNYDIRFQNPIAGSLPSFLVNPTKSLEDTASAKTRSPKSAAAAHGVGSKPPAAPEPAADGGLDLPVLGEAPEFVDNQRWFNTPGDRPLTLRGLRGRVVLVDFWTYSCINCIRTLPYLKAWDAVPQGRADDRRRSHPGVPVRARSRQRRIGDLRKRDQLPGRPGQRSRRPGTPTATSTGRPSTSSTPRGNVRFVHFGEGEYGEKEKVIRDLLAEAGRRSGAARRSPRGRALDDGDDPRDLPRRRPRRTLHQLDALAGQARLHRARRGPAERIRLPRTLDDHARLRDRRPAASLDLNFGARRVYLVLGSPGRPRRRGSCSTAGRSRRRRRRRCPRRRRRPCPASASTTSSTCPRVGHHVLDLEPEPGVEGYAFTFG